MRIFLKKNKAIIVLVFKQHSNIIWKMKVSSKPCLQSWFMFSRPPPPFIFLFFHHTTHISNYLRKERRLPFRYLYNKLEYNLSMNVSGILLTKRTLGTEIEGL